MAIHPQRKRSVLRLAPTPPPDRPNRPPRQAGRVHLVVHDWSTIAFGTHPGKEDRKRLTHDRDLGYDLHLALLVDATDGATVAPLDVTLTTATAALSTRPDGIAKHPAGHVDQVLPAMTAVADIDLGRARLVHVIDREADSVGHWRQWDPMHTVLVRADDRRCCGTTSRRSCPRSTRR